MSMAINGYDNCGNMAIFGYARHPCDDMEIQEKPQGRRSRHVRRGSFHTLCTFNVEELQMRAWPSMFTAHVADAQLLEAVLLHAKYEKSKLCTIHVIDEKRQCVHALQVRIRHVAKDTQTITFDIKSQQTHDIGYVPDQTDLILELIQNEEE